MKGGGDNPTKATKERVETMKTKGLYIKKECGISPRCIVHKYLWEAQISCEKCDSA